MLLPRLPLLDRLLKAPGTYRVVGTSIHKRLAPGVWYDAARCASEQTAQRIAADLNTL
jgi:hypothetical protein